MPSFSNGARHETAQCLQDGCSDHKADNCFEDPTMHKISYTKLKTCTTHIIILFSVHQVIQSIYNKVHLHSSAASLSVLNHPAPQFHGKIQSYYPPVRYIQCVPP